MTLTLVSVGLIVAVGLHTLFVVLAPHAGLQQALLLPPVFPPAAYNHNEDIRDVQQDKEEGFPCVYPPVKKDEK